MCCEPFVIQIAAKVIIVIEALKQSSSMAAQVPHVWHFEPFLWGLKDAEKQSGTSDFTYKFIVAHELIIFEDPCSKISDKFWWQNYNSLRYEVTQG